VTAGGGAGGRDRPKCGGKLRQREGTCTPPAGWGTPHPGYGSCKLHGGSTPGGVKAGQRAMAQAAVVRLGLPVTTTAEQALQDELERTNGHVLWLAGKCGGLTEELLSHGVTRVSRTRTSAVTTARRAGASSAAPWAAARPVGGGEGPGVQALSVDSGGIYEVYTQDAAREAELAVLAGWCGLREGEELTTAVVQAVLAADDVWNHAAARWDGEEPQPWQ
jgi:hypothetical protein